MKAEIKLLPVSILTIICLSSIFSTCSKEEKIKNVYNVTATFMRKTIPASSTQTQTLSFIDSTVRISRTDKVNMNVSDINVTMNKLTGNVVPPLIASTSLTFFRKDNDVLSNFNGFAGNTGWLGNHCGDLAVCTETIWLEHAPTEFGYNNSDSTVNIALTDDVNSSLHPVYRASGASYLAELRDNDQYIPWIHSDVPTDSAITMDDVTSNKKHLDMRSLTRMLFANISASVSASITGMPTFSWTLPLGINVPLVKANLGGPADDGNFKLHFVPQLQSNENGNISDTNNQVMRSPGIAFYFEATVALRDGLTNLIPIGTLKIIIPSFLTFERVDAQGNFQVELQPISDMTNGLAGSSTGVDKIIILATTPFGIASTSTASMIKESIKASLISTSTGNGGLGVFITSTIAFSTGFNKYMPNKQLDKLEFDIITIPNDCNNQNSPLCFSYNGIIPTQVQPEGSGSTTISTYILNTYKD